MEKKYFLSFLYKIIFFVFDIEYFLSYSVIVIIKVSNIQTRDGANKNFSIVT